MRRVTRAVATMSVLATASAQADTFYLVDSTSRALLVGDVANPAAAVSVATLPAGFWSDLASAPVPGRVFAVEVNSRRILTLDGTNGQVLQQVIVDRDVRSIAYNIGAGIMYALPQTGQNQLFTVNLTTGQSTVIGLTTLGDPVATLGLDYDPTTNSLYATTSAGALYAINPATAATALVGNMGVGFAGVFDVAYNPANGLLYGTNANDDSLYTLNRVTAVPTFVGGPYVNSTLGTGMAFDIPAPATGLLLALGGVLARRRRPA